MQDHPHTTLHSIGKAAIPMDALGNIDLLNPVAEQLTGWSNAEARGLPSTRVFDMVDDAAASWVDSIMCVLRENRIVPLAHNAALIQRNGYRVPTAPRPSTTIRQPRRHSSVFHDVNNREVTNKLSHQASP